LEQYLDTTAGEAEEAAKADQLQARYFALPPKKRSNYARLAVAAPFRPSWSCLLAEWRRENAPLPQSVVLRCPEESLALFLASEEGEDVLVPVRLLIQGRGTLSQNTMICLPLNSDLQALAGGIPSNFCSTFFTLTSTYFNYCFVQFFSLATACQPHSKHFLFVCIFSA
jgi:hypothetical protein